MGSSSTSSPARLRFESCARRPGVVGEVEIGESIGTLEYEVGVGECRYLKHVEYFQAQASPGALGSLPSHTRGVTIEDLDELELVNEGLRPILRRALANRGCLHGRRSVVGSGQ